MRSFVAAIQNALPGLLVRLGSAAQYRLDHGWSCFLPYKAMPLYQHSEGHSSARRLNSRGARQSPEPGNGTAGNTASLRGTIPAMQRASGGLRLHARQFRQSCLRLGLLAIRGYTQNPATRLQPRVRSRTRTPVNGLCRSGALRSMPRGYRRDFQRTGMARSFYRLSPRHVVENFKSGKRVLSRSRRTATLQ